MLRIGRRLALLGALAMAMTACGGDDDDGGTGPGSSIAGTYTLRTVNGDPVPATIFQEGDFQVQIANGQVVLNGDGTYRDTITYRLTDGTASEDDGEASRGTYTRSGNTLTFADESGGETVPATIDANGALVYILTEGSQSYTARFTK